MIRKGFYEDKSMAGKLRLRNKSGVTLHGVKSGEVVEVDADAVGTPLDRHWRNRLRDSKIDGCVEVLKDESTAAEGIMTGAKEALEVATAAQDDKQPVRKRGRKSEE